jgi:serine/threonine protein kinase
MYGVQPLRSRMNFRYYLIDFEFAAVYETDSPADDRLVAGLPVRAGQRQGQYGRVPAPEMLTGERYCPFAADVFQLGVLLDESSGVSAAAPLLERSLLRPQHLGQLSPRLVDLVKRMRSPLPADRPSAAAAVEEIKALEYDLTRDELRAPVPHPPPAPEVVPIDLGSLRAALVSVTT